LARATTRSASSRISPRAPFPVTIPRNPRRLGYSENFLAAAAHASGRYIAFCDQDDVWYPDTIATCVDTLERTGALACAHALDLIDEAGGPIGFLSQGIARDRVHEALGLSRPRRPAGTRKARRPS
jgi:glycosyltransferase involved in cell wall biosynthesis